MNPFPGLRPFTQEEDYLFFGREEQTLELLQRLATNRFVAVVGTSGSGKSSLVRCGLLSELLGGRMLDAGSSWEIAVTHPGGNPLALLTDALLDADLYDREAEHVRENLLATLSRSHFGLVEAVKQADLGDGTNFLLVVDQFEEIFRFQDAGQRQQEVANEFVSLLLEAAAQKEVPIYVVLTMRSDFIGECGQFEGLAEMVNRGEFLIPRLTRDQYKRVIEGPIKVAGGQIAPRLLQRLLNDLGQQADQLPCLQHALMRTWNVWAAKEDANALDLDDYQRVGKMSQALSLHADEIYESLATDRQRELCQGIFQALTVEETNSRGIRRPQRLGRLCQILEVSAHELRPIIDAYRQSGVTFLMPAPDVELTEQTIIDISHESLMRVWTRLRQWVEEETQAAGIYLRLAESADLHEQGKAGLYRDPELGIALAWRDAKRPNAAWAERYRAGFAAAIGFLEASQQSSVAEDQAKEAARQRELEQAQRLAEAERQRAADQARTAVRFRRFASGLAVVAVLALLATVFAWKARQEADKQRTVAVTAQENTEKALKDVETAKELADQNLVKAKAAEDAALAAELRSREFRYSTDIQWVATVVSDAKANATQSLARLADHDPKQNQEIKDKEDLRGFEWHYLQRLIASRATVMSGFTADPTDAAVNQDGELVTLDKDLRLQFWEMQTGVEARPALSLKRGRVIGQSTLSPDGRLVAYTAASKVHVASTSTGEEQFPPLPTASGYGLVFTPDSRMLVTMEASVTWWDATTGRPFAIGDSNAKYGGPLSLSSDGKFLVKGHSPSVSAYRLDPESHDVRIVLDNPSLDFGGTRAYVVSPDGQFAAISQMFNPDLRLYEMAKGTRVRSNSTEHAAPVSAIAFHPDGAGMLSGAMDGSIKFWRDFRALDKSDISLVGHSGEVTKLLFADNGSKVVSLSRDKTARVWDLSHSKATLQQMVDGSSDALGENIGVGRARFSPDGLFVATTQSGGPMRILDADTGEVVRFLPARSDGLWADSIAFAPDNRLLALGFGGQEDVSFVELWDLDEAKLIATMPGLTGIPGITANQHSGIVSGLEFSPDGKTLAAGFGSLFLLSIRQTFDHPMVIYDVASRRPIRWLMDHKSYTTSIDFSRDGSRMASASYDGSAIIWDTTSWKPIHVLNNPDASSRTGYQRVFDASFSPDGSQLATASFEGSVHVWDTVSGKLLRTLTDHANSVSSVRFSPDGRTLASGAYDATIRLWNTATWRGLMTFEPGVGMEPRDIRFSPDGDRLVAVGGPALLWSARPDGESRTRRFSEQLETLLDSKAEFSRRIRMLSDNPRLEAALRKLADRRANSNPVRAALSAARAHRHAARQEWAEAVKQIDLLKESEAKADDWLTTSGLVRLAAALVQENRTLEAAALLRGRRKHLADEALDVLSRRSDSGIEYKAEKGSVRITGIRPGSPASQTSLRVGDVLLKVNDQDITGSDTSKLDLVFKEVKTRTPIRLAVQHVDNTPIETVELVKGDYPVYTKAGEAFQRQLRSFRAEIDRMEPSPAVYELRAELAELSSDFALQVTNYSAAIEALERLEPKPDVDLRRLHARRGNAHVELKQWKQAHEDYSQVITDESTDEELLANWASAQAKVLVADRQESLENVWFDDAPPAGAALEGDTPWEIVGRPDHPVYSGEKSFRRQAPGISQHFFHASEPGLKIIKSGVLFAYVYLDPQDPPKEVMLQLNDGHWEHRAYWGEDLIPWGTPNTVSRVRIGPLPKTGEWVRLEVPVEKVGLNAGAILNGWAFTQFAGTCYWDRAGIRSSYGETFETPWQNLAAAYRIVDDHPAIDRLVEQRPKLAGSIGNLFVHGDEKDLRHAIEIFSKGIAPETTDTDLLIKRAMAYEELKDWKSAAADWSRAAGENPKGAKLLIDFAGRLLKVEQPELAAQQRQRAREILEATLKTDPGDAPAIEALAALLLDMSEPTPKWATLKPSELNTSGGAILALQDDNSLIVERKPHVVTLADPGATMQAIRIETSSNAASTVGDAPVFTEYRILSTDLPAEGFRGRYVRIDLPGNNTQFPRAPKDGETKVINLTELQVFRGHENIALRKSARQSSVWELESLTADIAVDGDTLRIVHTRAEDDPWWEVDLGSDQVFDRLVVWNRGFDPSGWHQRMNHFRVQILDESRRVVFERVIDKAPAPSQEITRQVQLVKIAPDGADGVAQWQISLDGNLSRRFRISRELKWSVLKPSTLTTSEGTQITAQDDGSFVASASKFGEVVLSELPAGTKSVRIETASDSRLAPGGKVMYRDYRIESLGTSRSRTGALTGRYVRIDLPGHNSQFPRQGSDGDLKMLNLTELQVFQGERNIALRKSARQSSDYLDTLKAHIAVDGVTDGSSGSAHTNAGIDAKTGTDPWWEVDLASEESIDRIVVWNHPYWIKRMNHFRVRVLDEDRNIVLEQVIDEAPNASREIDCRGWLVPKKEGQAAQELQWSFRPLKEQRYRISTTDTPPSWLLDTAERAWTMAKLGHVTPSPGTSLTPQADGSFVVQASDELIALPALADSVNAIRVETASTIGSNESEAPALRDYRVEAINAPRSESGSIQGRYVRIDLPGENERYPRRTADRAEKWLAIAECQVFQADRNIALNKSARQSSTFKDSKAGDWVAGRAVDGDTDGVKYSAMSSTTSERDPWWEIDLASQQPLDRIVLWNRTEGDTPQRMNHFRVRVLDADRNVVFEQVINEAPMPSREIDCRSLFVASSPPANGGGSQRSLRLSKDLGIDPGSCFRISSSDQLYSLEREEAVAEARKISHPVARLAAAYGFNGAKSSSANWFRKALDGATTDKGREPILTSLQIHAESLTQLLKQSPDDVDLQLALARSHVKQGQKELARKNLRVALTEFESARDIFTRLRAQNPEPKWTVLRPSAMTSEGGATLTLQQDGSILVGGEKPEKDAYTLRAPCNLQRITAIRLQALPHTSLPSNGPGRVDWGNFHLTGLRVSTGERQLVLNDIAVTFSEGDTWRNLIDGKLDHQRGWSVFPQQGEQQTAIVAVQPFAVAENGVEFQLLFSGGKSEALGRFRLSVTGESEAIKLGRFAIQLPGTELSDFDVSMGRALAGQNRNDEAVTAFARALDRIDEEKDRQKLIEQFQEYQAALTALAGLRPKDSALQLALAKSLATSGRKALDENRDADALPQLAKAQKTFAKLASQNTEIEWTVLQPLEMKSETGASLQMQPDGSIVVERPSAEDTYTLVFQTESKQIRALRLEALADPRLPAGGPGWSPIGNFVVSELSLEASPVANPDQTTSIALQKPIADFNQFSWSVDKAIDGSGITGWGVMPEFNKDHVAVFETVGAPGDGKLMRWTIRISQQHGTQHVLGRFRLSMTSTHNASEVVRIQQELKASGLPELQLALGNAYGRAGRADDAAVAFGAALDLSTSRDDRSAVLQAASTHAGVLDKLTAMRSEDASCTDALARHYITANDIAAATTAAAKARILYEQQLTAEPANARVASDLADLLLNSQQSRGETPEMLTMTSRGNAEFTLQHDGSLLVTGPHVSGDVYTLTFRSRKDRVSTVMLEVLPHDSLPNKGPGRHSSGNFQLQSFQLFRSKSDGSEQTPVAVSTVTASFTYSAPDADVRGTIDRNLNKVWHVGGRQGQANFATFTLAQPLTVTPEDQLTVVLEHVDAHNGINIGHFRLSLRGQPATADSFRGVAETCRSPWARLGAAYGMLNEPDRSRDLFERSIEAATNEQARIAAAQDVAPLKEIFDHLQERFPDDRALRLGQARYLATKHIAENRFQLAVNVLSGIQPDFPDDIELLNQRADALTKLMNWKAAEADYARVIAREKEPGKRRAAERLRAEVLVRLGQFQIAADTRLQEMMYQPSDWDGMRFACVSALLARRPEIARMAATRLFKRVHSHNDLDAFWSWMLIRLHTALPGLVTKENQQGLLAAAEKVDISLRAPLAAAIYYRLGDLKKAEPLLTANRNDHEFSALAALLLHDQGDTARAREFLGKADQWFAQEATKDLRSAIPWQTGWDNWAINRAVWREATRKLIGPRILELDSSLSKQPDQVSELIERARLLVNADLLDEALDDLERLVALKVETPETHALHGRVLVELHRDDEALPVLQRAMKGVMQNADVFASRGTILLRQGQTEAARSDLEKSLEREPTELAARSLAELLLAEAEKSISWTILKPIEMKSGANATLTGLQDDSILVSGITPDQDSYTVSARPATRSITAIRLEALPDSSLGQLGPGRFGNFCLTGIELIQRGKAVEFSDASATFEQDASTTATTVLKGSRGNGWAVWPRVGQAHALYLQMRDAIRLAESETVSVQLHFEQNIRHSLGRFRLSVTDDPDAFAREHTRTAALKSDNPWLKLAYARLLNNDFQRAASSFAIAIQRANDDHEQLKCFEHLSKNSDVAPDFVNQVLSALKTDEVSFIARFASLASRHGRIAAARTGYTKLASLEPANRKWSERAAQLTPETSILWNFDFGTDDWRQFNMVELAADRGVLKSTSSGVDPHFGIDVSFPAGWQMLTLRARSKEPISLEFFWSTATRGPDPAYSQTVDVKSTDKDWEEYRFLFRADGQLSQVRLDPGRNAGQQMEFDWIRLERPTEESLRKIVADLTLRTESGNADDDELKQLAELLKSLDAMPGTNRYREILTIGIAAHPDHKPLRMARSRLSIDQQQWQAAIDDLKFVITAKTKDATLFATRANAYIQLKQWEAAAADWTQALRLMPDDSGYLEARANVYSWQLGQPVKALPDWSRLIEQRPTHPWFWMSRAETYNMMGQRERAMADINRAVELGNHDNLWHSLRLRGDYLAQQGEWKRAATDIEEAFALNAAEFARYELYLRYAMLRLMVEDVAGYQTGATRLAAHLQNSTNPDQNHWLVLLSVAGPSAVTDKNADRLLKTIDRQQATNYATWQPRLRAAVLYRRREFQQAADLFDKNPDGPASAALNFIAAMAHHKLGHAETAQNLFSATSDWIKQQEDKKEGSSVPAGHYWLDWAVYKSLQREAETLLKEVDKPK